MAYVITQNCCKDASCVPVCPVDCIRPADGGDTEMLYIDPTSCIDCGACQEECPIDAIYHEDELPEHLERFRDLNAAYFAANPVEVRFAEPRLEHPAVEPGSLRVAIVGAGAAACYSAAELMRVGGVEVSVFDRLPTPFGLIRCGVAPDHQRTKQVADAFASAFRDPRLTCYFNVEVGRHISHDELMRHHHAVIYAVGASASAELGLPGEQLSGSHPAAQFVAWYNGHPDQAEADFRLSGERCVVIGNGNVALDVARILLLSPDELARTDIADHALKILSDTAIREVVVLARRGPADAAFSVGEFLALGDLPGVDILIDHDGEFSAHSADPETQAKIDLIREFAARPHNTEHKRMVFRFHISPIEFLGEDRVRGLRVGHRSGEIEEIETSLVLKAIGYRGTPLPGVPFDADRGIIPNEQGRVIGSDGQVLTGVYTAGWIKRGPRGVIGTNRACAQETVACLWEDYDDGRLRRELSPSKGIDAILAANGAEPVDWRGWLAIDAAERAEGAQQGRPRVKFVNVADMLAIAKREGPTRDIPAAAAIQPLLSG